MTEKELKLKYDDDRDDKLSADDTGDDQKATDDLEEDLDEEEWEEGKPKDTEKGDDEETLDDDNH